MQYTNYHVLAVSKNTGAVLMHETFLHCPTAHKFAKSIVERYKGFGIHSVVYTRRNGS